MRSVIAAIALLAGCDDQSCELDRTIERNVGLPSHNCGTLASASTADAFRAAHDCAVMAIAAHTPFVVTAPMVDTTTALVGTGSSDSYRVDAFVQITDDTGRGTLVQTSHCPEVDDFGACGARMLCLACGRPQLVGVVCPLPE